MKFLFDLFPVFLFFVVFKFAGIYAATVAAMVATIGQIIYVKLKHGKVDGMLIASGVIIVVFGGATLVLHDETFIKWKPTVLYWLFAVGLVISDVFMKKNMIRSVLEAQMTLPEKVWRNLNLAWSGFFVFLGILNLYVAFHFTTDQWVNFKMFGTMGLMMIFVFIQSSMLNKYIDEQPKDQ